RSEGVAPDSLALCRPGPPGACSSRDAAWIGLVWLAAVLFYWPVLFGGLSFYFRDTLSIYYPQAFVTASALRSGQVPLWEPSIGLGYPFQSDPHSMVGYPLTPLLLLLPFPRSYD